MSNQTQRIYEFGPFRLDPSQQLLLREGEAVLLTPKAFETLLVLVRHGGRVVEREELIKAVWPDTYVEENNLSVNIWMLRKALGQSGNGQSFIETVPKRGYRFAAPVRELCGEGAALVLVKQVLSPVVIEEQELERAEASAETRAPAGQALATAQPRRRNPSPAQRLAAATALLAAVLVLLAASHFWISSRREEERPATRAVRSIAVLPLRSFAAETNDVELGLCLTDVLITKLANAAHGAAHERRPALQRAV